MRHVGENMDLYFEEVNEKQYALIQEEINREFKSNKENNLPNFVNFTSYEKSTIGIYLNGALVGLFRLKSFIKGLTIDIYILPSYRGNGIANAALNQLVDEFGPCYPEADTFYANTSYGNLAANHAFQKLGWKEDHSFDERMMEEGGEFFKLYGKNNPYYIKTVYAKTNI